MPLSDLTKESVLAAIDEFDRTGSDAFLERYGFLQSRGYWLIYDGRHYPSKAIAGVAHGYIGDDFEPLLADDFAGGDETVKPALERWPEFRVPKPEPVIPEPGTVMTNAELSKAFVVGVMGGMRRNKSVPHLVLVSDSFKALYQDRWEGDILHYTGMGKVGPQALKSQNRNLANSTTTGERVYLCEAFEPKRYTFWVEVELADKTYQESQPDDNGDAREVFMFPIRLKVPENATRWSEHQVRALEEEQSKIARKLSDQELKKRAMAAKERPPRRPMSSVQFYRNAAVAEYVKRWARGSCELCGNEAPFRNRGGFPYLECHHIEWLAEGGEDSILNAVALCPNCHRKMHSLNRIQDQQLLKARVQKRDGG